jgi:hypothetical protein
MMQAKFTDRASIGTVKMTEDGFLITRARALRSGVQEYHASELGLMDSRIVKVFRPETSVKDADSLLSMSHAPITIGHPNEMVTADNWKELAVGEVSTKAQWDGDFIALDLILKDKAAIEAVKSGMAELSAGYVADMMPSNDPQYDFVMGPPRYNHLAIVEKARAGSKARIGDGAAKQWGAAPLTAKGPEMEIKTIVVGDKAVQVAASDADVITKLIADHKAAVDELKAELATVKIEAADAAKLVKTDDEIAAMVADGVKTLMEVTDKARKLVADYDATGKDAMTIRREVIARVYGDEAVQDLASDAEIVAAFKVAQSQAKPDPVLDAMKEKKKPEGKGSAWDGMYKAKKDDK